MAFSPDGRYLVSGGEDGQVIVWDFAQRLQVRSLRESWGQVYIVAFSGDGKWFAAGTSDGSVVVWDALVLRRAALLRGNKGKLISVAFSPDSRLLVSAADDRRTVVWEVTGWRRVHELPGGIPAYGNLLFLRDGRLLDTNGNAWKLSTGGRDAPPCGGSENWMRNWNYAACSPDAMRIPAIDTTGTVFFGDQARCVNLRRTGVHQYSGRAVAWSHNGRWAASGAENIIFWNASTATQLSRLEYASDVWSLAFSTDSNWLVSSHGDGSILLWDAARRERVADFRQHSAPVSAVAFSPDGRFLASAGNDRTILLWDTQKGRKEAPLVGHGTRVNSLAYSPDGRSPVSCDHLGSIIFWDLATRQPRWQIEGEDHLDIPCLSFSPDGYWVAASRYGLYGSATGREAANIRDQLGGTSYGLSFSPDGMWLANAVPGAGGLSVLDTATWRVQDHRREDAALQGFRVVCFSSDSRWLVTGDNQGAVRLWQPMPLRQVALLGRHADRVRAVAFSPDGNRVASAGDDRTIALWDIRRRRPLMIVGSHTVTVTSLSFSHDGRLASGEWDNSVRIYTRQPVLWGNRLNWSFLR